MCRWPLFGRAILFRPPCFTAFHRVSPCFFWSGSGLCKVTVASSRLRFRNLRDFSRCLRCFGTPPVHAFSSIFLHFSPIGGVELVSRFSPVFPGRPRFSLGAGLGPVRSGLPLAGCGFAIRHGPSLGVRPCFVHRFSPGFTGFHRFSIGPDPAAVAPGLRSAGCGFAFKERFGGVRDMHFRPFFCTFRELVR